MQDENGNKIRRALISVTDKSGIEDLAIDLHHMGIEIISTGGTATRIRSAGIPVVDVSTVTGFPEMLDGRVKTLNGRVFAGILNVRGNVDHQLSCEEYGVDPIDLVVVNLYAFEATVAKEGCSFEEAIENIDIGGPSLIRAAAKNWQDVTVVVDPNDYGQIIAEIAVHGNTLPETRRALMQKAFERTAYYDGAIAAWLRGPRSKSGAENVSAKEPFYDPHDHA